MMSSIKTIMSMDAPSREDGMYVYPKGSIWLMASMMTQEGTKPDGTPNMVPFKELGYIIVTKSGKIGRKGKGRDLELVGDYHIHHSYLKSEFHCDYSQPNPVKQFYYELEINSRICPTWFAGGLKPLTDEMRPQFNAALNSALKTLLEAERKRREDFRGVCETLDMWPLPGV